MLPDFPEASYLSRFFTKFVEIAAGGLATAMCAYLIAYLGIPLAPTAPATVSAAPSAAASSPAQPAAPVSGPPVAAAPVAAAPVAAAPVAAPPVAAPPVAAPPVAAVAVDDQRHASQPVTDALPAQTVRKAEKAAVTVPAPKDSKTGPSVARGEKSVEALARAALANVDADRPAAAEAPNRRASTGTGSAGAAAVEAQQRPVDVPPRQADIQPPPVAVEAEPRQHIGAVAALPPELPAEEVRGLFSIPKRILGLLRPGTPSFAGEALRPPLPVGMPE